MVSDTFIFAAGLLTTLLCVFFVVFQAIELRRIGRRSDDRGRGQK